MRFTPDALAKSNFKQCRLEELPSKNCDESFIFIFPSPNVIDEVNGDGILAEIWDFTKDFAVVMTAEGPHNSTKDTIVYHR